MPAPISSPIVDLFEQLGPLDLEDLPDLRRYLSWVPDPRSRRGRWYSLESLLVICVCAVLAGVTTVEGVCAWARNAPSEVRQVLRIRRHPLGWRRTPSRRCLTGLLARLDTDALDRAVAAWLAARRATCASAENDQKLQAVAVDGKSLRGSRDADRRRVHLLSAVDHDRAVPLAQRDVDRKTGETGEFKALLAWLDLAGTVVTFDALHTVKDQAKRLIETNGAHYIAIVKRGQKNLYRQLKHRCHGMNLQAIADGGGNLLWVSGAICGSVHDTAAARIWQLPRLLCEHGLFALGDKGYQGPDHDLMVTPYKGKGKPEYQKERNHLHTRLRGPGERVFAELKKWRVLRKFHCDPNRATPIVGAVTTLNHQERQSG